MSEFCKTHQISALRCTSYIDVRYRYRLQSDRNLIPYRYFQRGGRPGIVMELRSQLPRLSAQPAGSPLFMVLSRT